MRSERRAKILILLTDGFCCDTWWFMTRMVSVCDEADISRHHKSGGWVRRGEVSHTGSSEINFLWPLKTLQGNKDPKAEQQERKDNFPSLWRSPASESSHADAQMLLLLSPLSWCDHLQSSNLPCPRSALHKCGTRHFVTEQETSLSWRCHYKASIKTVWSFFSVTKLICSNRNSDLSDRHCVILPLLAPALL